MALFYPLHLPLPSELQHPLYYLRPLRASDAELDYDAVIASRTALRIYSLGRWPHDQFTLEENRTDLERHEREHLARERFAFTVLNPDSTLCLGCVYLKPLNSLLERAVNAPTGSPLAVRVTFWLRPECVAADVDRVLLSALQTWLREEWTFAQITFQANENETRRLKVLNEAGLTPQYTVSFTSTPIKFYLYG